MMTVNVAGEDAAAAAAAADAGLARRCVAAVLKTTVGWALGQLCFVHRVNVSVNIMMMIIIIGRFYIMALFCPSLI